MTTSTPFEPRTEPVAGPGPDPVADPGPEPGAWSAAAIPAHLTGELPIDAIAPIPVALQIDFLTAPPLAPAATPPVRPGAGHRAAPSADRPSAPEDGGAGQRSLGRHAHRSGAGPAADPVPVRRPWLSTLIAGATVTAAGLAVARWAAGSAVADALGDALYAVLVLLLVRFAVPARSRAVQGTLALAICVAVELAQLTGLPAAVVAAVPQARYLLGTTFVASDLLAYAAGVLGAVLLLVAVRARRGGLAPAPVRPAR